MNEIQLSKGDYVSVKAIHDYAELNRVKPKLMYRAIAARFVAAGFRKPNNTDNFFKENLQFFGVLIPSHGFQSVLTFFNEKTTGVTLDQMRCLLPQRILFADAPEWAVDVRDGGAYAGFMWTDGATRYQHFKGQRKGNRTARNVVHWPVVAKRPANFTEHATSLVNNINSTLEISEKFEGWYDYENQVAVALPPVGTEAEFRFHDEWRPCRVIAHDEAKAVCNTGDYGYRAFDKIALRPLDWHRDSAKITWCQDFEYAFSQRENESIAEAVYRMFTDGLIQAPNLEQAGSSK